MKDINESTIFIRRSIRSFIKEKKVEPEMTRTQIFGQI